MSCCDSRCWRTLFKVKGIYNYAASVGMFFIDDWLRARFSDPQSIPPADPVYRTMFLALCFAFGMGYCTVSRDLTKNHAVIRMGILGQLAVFAVTTWGVFLAKPSLPSLYMAPAAVDLAFAIAFLVFLWKYPKSNWTQW